MELVPDLLQLLLWGDLGRGLMFHDYLEQIACTINTFYSLQIMSYILHLEFAEA
jgi:hypothetical protein